MVLPARPLSSAQAVRFTQAVALLQSGQHPQALSIAETLVREAPQAADAWQLLGMCLADGGHATQSDAAFEHALDLLPGNASVSSNYAMCLARRGKLLRARDQFEAAAPVLRKALALSDQLVSAWVDLGVVLRRLGRIDEALTVLRRAERMLEQRGADVFEVRDAINGVLADAGRPAEALAGARALVASHPDRAPAHETLSTLLWEHGAAHAPDEDPMRVFGAAAQAQSGNLPLQLSFARMLLAARRPDEALAVLHPLRKREPENALLAWFAADALDALHERGQATRLYDAASRGALAELPEFLNARARHAFRTQRFDLAASCAENAVKRDPGNQEGWCHLGTAWRLIGDAREHWLCDYEALVGDVEVAPPPGYADMASFLVSLGTTLEGMHTASREPVNQSVRGGSQTAGQLFGRDDPVIRAAEDALRTAVERWLMTLPASATHPFLARKQYSVQFVGSWSVRLNASGRHANHLHPRGWASSAFYVALPNEIFAPPAPSHAGWLQLGQPLEDLELDLLPRRIIQPRPGHLALFPSYMWHGTVPFESAESRLTVAFDMQPKI
ncbi:putative 2OG-Fe(II) oxygenase [Luteimonas sp. 3794]|uniref:putative 2OG-Fe(II) oxygenase n=1 Tax=Luteimonas sp. 3794 TaxID=2817730 RepID=UPI0028668EC6|nr:putative 2OG-Fe(II) oxygenase [Luteimonas sp. 3794]MDR6991560.1 Flp pilus assembly protein TadD [Luteimonas sp. 3794]